MRGLAGRPAIVTGGANGIGRACSLRLGVEGCPVIIIDVDDKSASAVAEAICDAGGAGWFLHADVSDPAALEQVLADATNLAGPATILVNNAAYLRSFAPVTDTDPEDWARSFATGPTASFTAARALLPGMIRAGAGSIVHIASVGGQVAFERYAAYCSAKAAVIQLARSIAADYGQFGITANAVLPGAVRTQVIHEATQDPVQLHQLEAMSVLGRIGEADEIAGAVAFLCSSDASFITGAAIPVDGGWTLR